MVEYFAHDYNSRHDPKLLKLQEKHGLAGIGLFWCVVEFCFEQDGKIKESECESIAFDMRTHCDLVKSVLNDFGLFVFENGIWHSETIDNRLKLRDEKSSKAAKSAFKRWNKCERNANALEKVCDGNAIKEKEIKEKESIKRASPFIPPSLEDITEYCKQHGIDPLKFHAHYTSNGWMVGKAKMKNWKAAVITWTR
jgi:hypothetical protein